MKTFTTALVLVSLFAQTVVAETPRWLKKLDPTNPDSEVRQIGRDIDLGNKNGYIRETFAENDPWENLKEETYEQMRDSQLAKIRGWQSIRLGPGNVHFDRLVAGRDRNGQRIFDPEVVMNVEFYFGVNIELGALGVSFDKPSGLTLGNRVLIQWQYDESPDLTKLLAHELAHIYQVRRMGESGFGRKYVSQAIKHGAPSFVRGGFEGKSASDTAHESLPLEQEAHAVEEQWFDWFNRDQSQRQANSQATMLNATVANQTTTTLTFMVKNGTNWERFDLQPGQSRWFQNSKGDYSIGFDADMTGNVANKTYRLGPGSTNDFRQSGSTVDLYLR